MSQSLVGQSVSRSFGRSVSWSVSQSVSHVSVSTDSQVVHAPQPNLTEKQCRSTHITMEYYQNSSKSAVLYAH